MEAGEVQGMTRKAQKAWHKGKGDTAMAQSTRCGKEVCIGKNASPRQGTHVPAGCSLNSLYR